jgi:hypothetical protein
MEQLSDKQKWIVKSVKELVNSWHIYAYKIVIAFHVHDRVVVGAAYKISNKPTFQFFKDHTGNFNIVVNKDQNAIIIEGTEHSDLYDAAMSFKREYDRIVCLIQQINKNDAQIHQLTEKYGHIHFPSHEAENSSGDLLIQGNETNKKSKKSKETNTKPTKWRLD